MTSNRSVANETMGVRTYEYKDVKRGRPVLVEVWYPTEAKMPIATPAEDIYLHPKESRNSPLALSQKPYPLITMSHGHRGDRRDRSWLSERLVKAGFIVVSVEHFGNSYTTFDPLITLKYWERARDVSFALDQILQEPFFQSKIDLKRIGFVGYSLGGMTGLALAGSTVEDLGDVLAAHKDALADFPPELLSQVNFSEATCCQHDPRIGAVFLIAPANFVYKPDALKKIQVPVGLVSAINDEVLPHHMHAYPIIQHVIPVKLKVLRKEISHFAFLNPISEMGKKLLPEKYRNDPPCCSRASIHQEVGDFAVEFFREQLPSSK